MVACRRERTQASSPAARGVAGRGGVRPHAVQRLVEPHRVAPALVHLAAVVSEHAVVGDHDAVERAVLEGDGHEQQRGEPVADLRGHLHHEIGREPARPGHAILQVGQGGEGRDVGIEPAVADLGHPGHGPPAAGAAEGDRVDPRPVELLEGVDGGRVDGEGAHLRDAAHHGGPPAPRTRVERQGHAPVALARDAPVRRWWRGRAGGSRRPG